LGQTIPVLKAITFDFWDTIVKDQSDEPKRAARGLPPKAQIRTDLLAAEIQKYHPSVTSQQVRAALQHATDNYHRRWKIEHFTPTVPTRLRVAYAYLGLDPTPGFKTVVHQFEELKTYVPPDFAPNIRSALAELSASYRLGIISDTGYTAGRVVRHLLEQEGLLHYFSHFSFSDEVGAAKPSSLIFRHAATGLDVPPTQLLHIGDREDNDVGGALAAGAAAILYTGCIDRGSATTRASAVCRNFADLPQLLTRMSAL
jgi:putative hydrolase of the HAD superfamily